MTYYALRNRKSGALLTCLAATSAQDDSGEISASRRIIEVEGVILVGGFSGMTLYATRDLETAALLALTGDSHEPRNRVVLHGTVDAPAEDTEIVTLPDLAPVAPDTFPQELRDRLAEFL